MNMLVGVREIERKHKIIKGFEGRSAQHAPSSCGICETQAKDSEKERQAPSQHCTYKKIGN